jgi:hypothetical protein
MATKVFVRVCARVEMLTLLKSASLQSFALTILYRGVRVLGYAFPRSLRGLVALLVLN